MLLYVELFSLLMFSKSFKHTLIFTILTLLSVIFVNKSHVLSFISLENYLLMLGLFTLVSFITMLVFSTLYIYNKRKNVVVEEKHVRQSFKFYEFYDIISFIFVVVATLLWCIIFILTPVEVRGDSMIDTCYNEDKVIVWHLNYEINRGNIVVADAEGYNFNEDTEFIIKRVFAKPGDEITYSKYTNVLRVNGKAVIDGKKALEFNLDYFQMMLTNVNSGELHYSLEEIDGLYRGTVPAGYYILWGDNYNNSQDSRYVGLIAEEDILGICIFRIYPFTSFGLLR